MGSGIGKTSTRGHKGQRSRSGSRMMRGFEGGQMPLHRRMPKRGFTNIFRQEFNIVNLEKLAAGRTTITPDVLRKAGVIKSKHPVKVLGDGELTIALTVHAHKFSKSAQEKITKAGGKFEVCRQCWKNWPTSFAFPISASGFCSRWDCWRSTAWAARSPRRESIPISEAVLRQNTGSLLGFVDLFSGGQSAV